MKTSLKASLIALAIASFPICGHAAGLGQINVFSGLGQPLRAEIAVSATAQELQSLTARIASADAFRAANLPFSAAAAAVRVSVDARGGRPVVRLSSVRPINDPFVELLVELNWASGQLAREYTFLLDPVDLTAPRPAAARVDAAAAPVQLAPRAIAPPPVVREAERASARAAVADRYTVRRGDTLLSIAANTVPAGANLDQMLIALFRANPGAFEGANINRLKAGSVLAVPSADRVQSIDAAEARREILAQATDFEAYRRRLAGAVAAQPAAAEASTEQASAGRIVPKVEDSRSAADSGDKVRVSRSEGPGAGDTNARLQTLEEELATREKALQDANARLAHLEQSIRDMQKLLEVRSASLAQAQQQAGGALPAPAAPAPVPPSTPAVVAAKEPPPTTPAAADDAAKAQTPADATSAPAPAPEAPPVQKPQARQARAVPPPPPPEEPDLLASLLGNPSMLAAGGGVAALMLALVGLKLRRRRSESAVATDVEEPSRAPQGPERGAVFGETGGQSVDTGNSMLMTDFSQSGLSAIDTDEGVDPVAEADVYMAYGRDAQAEEILQDALKADPDRMAIYLKLLEIYSQRKSVKQFDMIATDLYARTGGRGPDWDRAAAMGRKLDPENPLYGPQAVARDGGRAAPTTEVSLATAGLAAAAAMATASAAPVTEPLSGAEAEPSGLGTEAPVESLSALDFTTSLPIEPSQSQLKDTWTLPGDLSPFVKDADDKGVAAPTKDATAAAVEAPELQSDLDVIDFDLGLDEPETEAEPVSVPTGDLESGAPAAESADPGLTFDLDIGDLDFTTASAGAQGGSRPHDDVEGAIDDQTQGATTSAFDFELPDLELESAAGAPPDLNATAMDVLPLTFEPETTALGMDFESAAESPNRGEGAAADLRATVIAQEGLEFDPDATALDLDFELPEMSEMVPLAPIAEPPPTVVTGGKATAETDLEKTSFDSSLLDFDFDLEPVAAEPSPVHGLDLTSIDLDLNAFDEETSPSVEQASAAAIAPAVEAVAPENFEEIETKLELARAYEEMGDKEGALELLDEVLREGGAQQQASAREMIARLG